MKTFNRATLALAMLAAGAVSLGGCATKGFVREQVGVVGAKEQADTAEVNGKLQTQDAHLSQHDTQLADLDKNTKEALDRAQAAGKLAEGKFLYSMVLSDDSVKFPVSGTELSDEAKSRLNDFAQKLKTDNKNVYLEIQGHTDNKGSKAINMRLGEERAEAVRLYLNQQGVALNRMSTISYGGTSPAAPNKTRAGRAQNRRVVVVVLA